MNLRFVIIVVYVTLLPGDSLAQSPPSQPVLQHAESLLDKARQLSDIRSPNAPPFRLTATFSFIGKDLETSQGTYTEIWVSGSQWRRETVVKDLRRLEVAGPTRTWTLDNTTDFPEPAAQFSSMMTIFPSREAALTFDSLVEPPEIDPPATCALTKPDFRHLKSAFCFDKKNGLILEKISPEMRPHNVVDNSCSYGSFEKFGDYLYPRQVLCFEDRHRKLEAKVVDLSPYQSPDPTLFIPPAGATELGRCPVKPVPPQATSSPAPQLPPSFGGQSREVIISLIVDAKGKPQNVIVVNPAGDHVDELAIRAVQSWRFKPATCNGEPMPTPIGVQFDVRLFH